MRIVCCLMFVVRCVLFLVRPLWLVAHCASLCRCVVVCCLSLKFVVFVCYLLIVASRSFVCCLLFVVKWCLCVVVVFACPAYIVG